jgi:hypothetical protein
LIDDGLIAQRVSDLLQLLSLIAQVYGFPALAGAGLFRFGGQRLGFGVYAVLGAAGARSAWQSRGVIQTAEIDDHDKKPLGIWTLAMVSAIPGQTLGAIDNKPACTNVRRTV